MDGSEINEIILSITLAIHFVIIIFIINWRLF